MRFKCDICNAATAYKCKTSLDRHLKEKHSDLTTSATCAQCGKVYPSQSLLICHVRYMHKLEKRFKCGLCNYMCKIIVELEKHNQVHTESLSLNCEFCGKTFKNSRTYQHHVKNVHNREENSRLACVQCSKTFGTKHALRNHVFSVHECKNNEEA